MKLELATALVILSGLASADTAPVCKTPTTLNELAVAAGKMYFGTATNQEQWNDTKYVDIMLEQFGSLTPANVQKWMFTEPEEGVFNYTAGDAFADFAAEHNQILLCDTLIWHQQYPSWLDQKNWTKDALLDVIDKHVYSEVSHFKDRCFSWNVVNEAFNEDGTFRESLFYNVTGTDYIATAFKAAARADPKAQLYYNDYNIEFPNNKSAAVENLVKSLQAQDAKIDAVGLQAHFIVNKTASEAQQQQQMQAYIDLGVQVVISELDVRFESLPPSEALLAQQTVDYEASIQACINVGKQCMGISVWDFVDTYSWVPTTFAGNGDACLWYSNYTTIPAFDGVVSVLKAAGVESTCASSAAPTTLTTEKYANSTATEESTYTEWVTTCPEATTIVVVTCTKAVCQPATVTFTGPTTATFTGPKPTATVAAESLAPATSAAPSVVPQGGASGNVVMSGLAGFAAVVIGLFL